MSTSFPEAGFCWKSSTEPKDERDVDEADAVGESSGVPAVELATVEGIDSAVVVRLMAAFCDKAVVLIVSTSGCVWDRWDSSMARRAESASAAHCKVRGGPNVAVERGGVYQWLRKLNESNVAWYQWMLKAAGW